MSLFFFFFTFFRLCTIRTLAWAQRWRHTAASPCGPPGSPSSGFSLLSEDLWSHTQSHPETDNETSSHVQSKSQITCCYTLISFGYYFSLQFPLLLQISLFLQTTITVITSSRTHKDHFAQKKNSFHVMTNGLSHISVITENKYTNKCLL